MSAVFREPRGCPVRVRVLWSDRACGKPTTWLLRRWRVGVFLCDEHAARHCAEPSTRLVWLGTPGRNPTVPSSGQAVEAA